MEDIQVWRALARRIHEVNEANGWEAPTFESAPVKIMLAVTELDEGVQGVHGREDDPIEVEIADTAVRLLHLLETVWPGQWDIRGGNYKQESRFQEIERLLWPVVNKLCKAVESWRQNDRFDVRVWLECAFAETRRIAASLGFDLYDEMKRKVEKNSTRGYLHGKANPAG